MKITEIMELSDKIYKDIVKGLLVNQDLLREKAHRVGDHDYCTEKCLSSTGGVKV